MKAQSVIAATCILLVAIVGPGTWVYLSPLSLTGGRHNNNLSIDEVKFSVIGCTNKSYSNFLKSLRRRLSRGTIVHEIPLLPHQSASGQDLLLLEFFDWSNKNITLVLDRINAYVIAYKAKNLYYLLADTPANPQVYGRDPYKFTFTGSYIDLERVAKENRENIDLGINQLATAISILYYWSPNKTAGPSSVARSLIVLIQMISETARFGAIEQRVLETIIDDRDPIRYNSFRPGVGVMDLQNNWGTLSTAVQRSNQKGKFLQPVILKVTYQKTIEISDAKKARTYCGLALLLYCRQNLAMLSPRDDLVLSSRDSST